MYPDRRYNNKNKLNSFPKSYFCHHNGGDAWEYKLTIADRKIYQCSICGDIQELPIKANLGKTKFKELKNK